MDSISFGNRRYPQHRQPILEIATGTRNISQGREVLELLSAFTAILR